MLSLPTVIEEVRFLDRSRHTAPSNAFQPTYRPSRRKDGSLLALPNETLTEIASYLPKGRPVTYLMRVCRRLSGVGEYIRYTNLVVAGERGKRLLVTLSSGTCTSRRYCLRVKRMWFKGWDAKDKTLQSYLFTAAVPLMDNLRTLWVESPSFDTKFLLQRLTSFGITRPTIHQSFCLVDECNNPTRRTTLNLLSLQYVRLSATPQIISLATHRPLVNLDLNIILDKDAFGMLISSSENSILGRSLVTLSIRLAGILNIALAFPMVATAFPALKHLSFDQLDVDIRVVLDFIGFDVTLLKELRILSLNRRVSPPSRTVPPKWMSQKPLDPITLEHTVQAVFEGRRTLLALGVWKTGWEVGPYGGIRDIPQEADEWRYYFDLPFETCELFT